MTSPDPYARLRPPKPTPDDERCVCSDSPSIVLRSVLTPNPLGCLTCNLEVPPDLLGFPEELSDALAAWRSLHDSIYILWLRSGDLETSAKQQLESPTSPVNERGLQLASQLSAYRQCYYWWFADPDEESTHSSCVRCGGELQPAPRGRSCESCRIVYEA